MVLFLKLNEFDRLNRDFSDFNKCESSKLEVFVYKIQHRGLIGMEFKIVSSKL
jgi:hypothetical protein